MRRGPGRLIPPPPAQLGPPRPRRAASSIPEVSVGRAIAVVQAPRPKRDGSPPGSWLQLRRFESRLPVSAAWPRRLASPLNAGLTVFCSRIARRSNSRREATPVGGARMTEPPTPLKPCRYYLMGSCVFGDGCRHQPRLEREDATELDSSLAELSLDPLSPVEVTPPGVLTGSFQPNPDAQEFVPRGWTEPTSAAAGPVASQSVAHAARRSPPDAAQRSWAHIVNPEAMAELSPAEAESQLCPFGMMDECHYGESCAYLHGQLCEYCGHNVLHPTHAGQRRAHHAQCLRVHEEAMEASFAVARSQEKTCGICMETVMDKDKGEARFGILPNCNHCFCLSCLRQWRQVKQFENKIIRACPECRQTSDFICPSRYWVDSSEEKDRLISEYKVNLNKKECKYFQHGQGECPFGNKCFYRHADASGQPIDVGPPQPRARRTNADGELTESERMLIFDYLRARDDRRDMLVLENFDLSPEILELLELTLDMEPSLELEPY
eukprot:snap_masked-scaffold1811_size27320-processed-gene-0.9 protein:Tk00382 transcript:snap_masked-scaffold1811_size27320-processed-gene-0.9-mRNA-1 annotation:"hypothetical protein DAPPUDRAFT_302153"